jgi:hypothetical protein
MNHNVAARVVIDTATTASHSNEGRQWNRPVLDDFVVKYLLARIAMFPAVALKMQEGRACTISH